MFFKFLVCFFGLVVSGVAFAATVTFQPSGPITTSESDIFSVRMLISDQGGQLSGCVVTNVEVSESGSAKYNLDHTATITATDISGLQTGGDVADIPSTDFYGIENAFVEITHTILSDGLEEPTENIISTIVLSCVDGTTRSIPYPEIIILDIDREITGQTLPEPEKIMNTTCDSLRSSVGTYNISDRETQDQETIAALTGDDKSFYLSNCEQNDSTRNFEPEEISSQTNAVLTAATQQLRNVRSRLDTLRSTGGKRGVDTSGVNLNIQGNTIPTFLLGGAAGDDQNELLGNSRWGVFTNGEYSFGENNFGLDSNVGSGDRNLDFNSKGLTVGADYRFNGEKLVAGAAIGYKDFTADFTTQSGGTDTQGYNLSLYGTYLVSDKSYFDAIIGFGNSSVESRRPVNNDGSGGIGSETTFAVGNSDANEVTFSVGGGYEFSTGKWSYTPYGRLDYTQGTIDSYTETPSHPSASTSMFRVDEQDIQSLTSSLGIKASRIISTSSGVFVPQISFEWKHEIKDRGTISGQSTYLENSLIGVGSGFTETHRTEFDRNYFNIGAGVSAVFPKGRSAYFNLESRLGDDDVEDYAVKAGFRMEF